MHGWGGTTVGGRVCGGCRGTAVAEPVVPPTDVPGKVVSGTTGGETTTVVGGSVTTGAMGNVTPAISFPAASWASTLPYDVVVPTDPLGTTWARTAQSATGAIWSV